MDFGEVGFNVSAHHVARLAHRLASGTAFPGVGPEVIGAEDDSAEVDAFSGGEIR